MKTNEFAENKQGEKAGTLPVPATAFLSRKTDRGETDAKCALQSMTESRSVCVCVCVNSHINFGKKHELC